jgi:hypothetical protein
MARAQAFAQARKQRQMQKGRFSAGKPPLKNLKKFFARNRRASATALAQP